MQYMQSRQYMQYMQCTVSACSTWYMQCTVSACSTCGICSALSVHVIHAVHVVYAVHCQCMQYRQYRQCTVSACPRTLFNVPALGSPSPASRPPPTCSIHSTSCSVGPKP